MIIYNVTTKVHASIDKDWLQWQQQEHIPDIMATGLFSHYTFSRLLEQDDSEGKTYAVQYTAAAYGQYQQYIAIHAPLLRKKAFDKWGDFIISFRTVLEVIQ
jgi:Domain of unknown function (DUF4286)